MEIDAGGMRIFRTPDERFVVITANGSEVLCLLRFLWVKIVVSSERKGRRPRGAVPAEPFSIDR